MNFAALTMLKLASDLKVTGNFKDGLTDFQVDTYDSNVGSNNISITLKCFLSSL